MNMMKPGLPIITRYISQRVIGYIHEGIPVFECHVVFAGGTTGTEWHINHNGDGVNYRRYTTQPRLVKTAESVNAALKAKGL